MFHKLKLRFRRRLRTRQRQAEDIASQSGAEFDRLVLSRLGKLPKVARFVFTWTGLMVLLIVLVAVQNRSLSSYYQTRQPVAGGIYNEGLIGTFTNASPIYATNPVDKTVSRLVFAGLFKYDDQNRLVGDLAKDWSVDDKGLVYTVNLRHNLKWQDGEPLTAKDVVFTYQVIQNPDAESPLRGSWAGIKVEARDRYTVTFTLPTPLVSFVYTATTGIVPEHILSKTPMVGMRSSSFNTQTPIGAGAFSWRDIDVRDVGAETAQQTIGLLANDLYWAGKPKLKSFNVHAYANRQDMIDDFKDKQLTAMSGLPSVPAGVNKDEIYTYSSVLTGATMVFFKTSSGVLAEAPVRKAVVAAADPASIIKNLDYPTRPVREPLLIGQLGYDASYAQHTGDVATARSLLDGAGWMVGQDGYRYKAGKKLQFTLSIADTGEYRRVATQLQAQLKAAGVDMQIAKYEAIDFQSIASGHDYDAVLYGISIGTDPDVFVYWDSSQADIRSSNRLNLSEYKSSVVDDALDGGRTRSDPALRVIKYRGFLQQWQQDVPALGLYQPRSLYITHTKVYGLTEHSINESTDRLFNANNWMIRTARVTNPR